MPNYKKTLISLSTLLFVGYSLWWFWLFFNADPDSELRNYFTDTYGIIAGFGGIIGLVISRKWGGLKSLVGKSLVFLSMGLLCQFLGQVSYSIEFYVYNIANSYPSFGEIFYFASIPFYIVGVWAIAKASGSKISLKRYRNKISAALFPMLLVGISYYMFIRGTPFEEFDLITNILNFAYPIGQAIFVSMAILTYYLTLKVLGGVMRVRVLFMLFALIFQYIADSAFLYKNLSETWYPADISDYMFVISYFLMTLTFIQFLTVFEQFKKAE